MCNLFYFQFFGRYLGFDFYPSSYKYASRNDDQVLIFNTNSLPFDGAFTQQDKIVSKNLLKLWTNFMKNGQNPSLTNFSWTPLNDEPKLCEISSQGLKMIPINYDTLKFWSENIWAKIPPKISLHHKKVSWKFDSNSIIHPEKPKQFYKDEL